jgi:hypothetical protein
MPDAAYESLDYRDDGQLENNAAERALQALRRSHGFGGAFDMDCNARYSSTCS